MNVADFAIPVSCKTIEETNIYVLQFAIMASVKDAIVYARNCRKYGALTDTNGKYVSVTYYKDENGKVGPKYS
jgi:hypothetical protein